MPIKRQKIVADFETTTTKEDLRVWGVCAVDIETAKTVYLGNNIEGFIEWLKDKNTVCYFHNLKFDSSYILDFILKARYKYEDSHKPNTFETLITDDGAYYSLTIYFEKGNKEYKKVVFYDSLKKLPFKVSTISKAFDLKDEKLKIDYDAPRPVGHELTEEEKAYIVNDCRIVAQALKIQFDQGLTKMTNASDAMNHYKKTITRKQFEHLFPVFPVELDADIRRAYKGGFTYLNPIHKNERGLEGITFDVNSLYPSVMYNCVLPYGYPIYFEGEPEDNDRYPLYIVRIRCCFDVKPGHIPTIQLKNNRRYVETEYLTTSKIKQGREIIDEPVELTLTNVDLKLFQDHYNIYDPEYVCGWRFNGKVGMFKEYIDYWMKIKETTTGALRQLAKLQLNSLYGRFAMNPLGRKKIPVLDQEDDTVAFKLDDPEERNPVYTAMGCFITAYAREKTIRSAQAVYDRFIYADTDSLHLIGTEVPEGLDVHPTRLGAWKNEGSFTDSKFIRAKTYMETVYTVKPDTLKNYATLMDTSEWIRREEDGIHCGIAKVTCAGMPDNVKENVTYDNFQPGASFFGKLMPRRYPGGILLEKTTFTIQ